MKKRPRVGEKKKREKVKGESKRRSQGKEDRPYPREEKTMLDHFRKKNSQAKRPEAWNAGK